MNTRGKKTLVSDFLNIFGMLLLGLFVAIFVYPFLHEGGHSLAAFLVGADVVEFEILPVPYVVCNVIHLTNAQQIIVGISGMLLPLFIGAVIPNKWFWCWYVRFLLLGISLLAFVISAVSVVLPIGIVLNPQDDMLRVLSLWSYPKSTLVTALVVCVCLITVMTVKDRPIKKIYRKFLI